MSSRAPGDASAYVDQAVEPAVDLEQRAYVAEDRAQLLLRKKLVLRVLLVLLNYVSRVVQHGQVRNVGFLGVPLWQVSEAANR